MTKEQEVKEILNKFKNNETQRDKLERGRDGGWKIGDIYKHLELNPAIETVLSMLKEKDSEIERLEQTLTRNIARNVTASMKESAKSKEDLEMLNKGWQIELEKKDKQIDLMAEYIAFNQKVNSYENIKTYKEQIKQHYENQSKLFKYDYNKKSTLDINSNAKI